MGFVISSAHKNHGHTRKKISPRNPLHFCNFAICNLNAKKEQTQDPTKIGEVVVFGGCRHDDSP